MIERKIVPTGELVEMYERLPAHLQKQDFRRVINSSEPTAEDLAVEIQKTTNEVIDKWNEAILDHNSVHARRVILHFSKKLVGPTSMILFVWGAVERNLRNHLRERGFALDAKSWLSVEKTIYGHDEIDTGVKINLCYTIGW